MLKILKRMRAMITMMLKGIKHKMMKKLVKRMTTLKKMRSPKRMRKPIGSDYMLAFANKISNGC